MQYNTGDRLKYTGISEKYKTVVTDIPTGNKTIGFSFYSCSDNDGNNYSIVKIGNQWWMAENLQTTKYRDGAAISNVTDNTAWAGLTTGAYCWYNNDAATYKNTYGALFNWYAANTGKLCPTGWHVPTDVERTTLSTYLGGESVAGGKMKETGHSHWFNANDFFATNESGFSALPGGYRRSDGPFYDVIYGGNFWSATEYNALNAWYWYVSYGNVSVGRNNDRKGDGFSVRCLRD